MSSETSTSPYDPARLPAFANATAGPSKPGEGGKPDTTETLQPWQLFTLAGLIGATIVVFMSRGQSPASIILLSTTIFTAAAMGVAAYRTFSPISREDEPVSVTVAGGRTRVALEREKALVLRSIKELEFDRSMGKVSEKDFDEMSARLRGRAAGLMQQLDAGVSYREQIQRELEQRVKTPAVAAARTCASCKTANELDARFCKSCGAGLAS
jgi:hypothetical protein